MSLPANGLEFDVRLLVADSPDYLRALHLVHDVTLPAPDRTARLIADLVASARRGTTSIDLLFGAYRGGELVSAALAIEPPGKAALVLFSGPLGSPAQSAAAVAVLRGLQEAAWRRSIALLEVLVVPEAAVLGKVLRGAGFRYLTRLLYLRRRAPEPAVLSRIATDIEWVTYAPDLEPLFEEAVERTYSQSLDCPELAGLRSMADVLAGHRATGVFDAACWWVAKRHGESVGVILLNRMVSVPGLELVYMGVAQPARGTGVADALLARAVRAASRFSDNLLALAVDERNLPARRMYARWGFVETGVRAAWIATPSRV